MPDEDNRETLRRIINTIEQPDTPERQAAIEIRKSREQKQRRSEHVAGLIFRVLFIALLIAVLFKTWSESAAMSQWASLMIGSGAGVAFWIVIDRRKSLRQKSLPSSVVLIAGISVLTISLFVSAVKSLIPQPLISSMIIVGTSFLLVISIYALILYWQAIKKGEPYKSIAS